MVAEQRVKLPERGALIEASAPAAMLELGQVVSNELQLYGHSFDDEWTRNVHIAVAKLHDSISSDIGPYQAATELRLLLMAPQSRTAEMKTLTSSGTVWGFDLAQSGRFFGIAIVGSLMGILLLVMARLFIEELDSQIPFLATVATSWFFLAGSSISLGFGLYRIYVINAEIEPFPVTGMWYDAVINRYEVPHRIKEFYWYCIGSSVLMSALILGFIGTLKPPFADEFPVSGLAFASIMAALAALPVFALGIWPVAKAMIVQNEERRFAKEKQSVSPRLTLASAPVLLSAGLFLINWIIN